jgi:hypothetical protein
MLLVLINNQLHRLFALASLICLISVSGFTYAKTWEQLTDEQQVILSDFSKRWDDMPLKKRERLLKHADDWQTMSPEKQEALKQRWNELKQFPPNVRQALRERWDSMTPEEQREAVRNWKVKPQ